MNKYQYSILASGIALLIASCADTVKYIAPEEPKQPPYDVAYAKWEAALPSSGFVDKVETVPTDTLAEDYDDYLENQEFKSGRVVTITWNGSQVTVDNPQEEKGVKVEVNGGRVVVSNLESAEDADDARGKMTYKLKGQSEDGQFKIYSDKKFQLQLDGLKLSCTDGAAINIQSKKRCFLTCTEGTINELSDSKVYAHDLLIDPEEDEKGCVFSEGQILLYGPGELQIRANHSRAIVTDEYLHVHSGSRLNVLTAPGDGIRTKLKYLQTGGLVRSYSNKDALQADSVGVYVIDGYLYLCGSRGIHLGTSGVIDIDGNGKIVDYSWGVRYE